MTNKPNNKTKHFNFRVTEKQYETIKSKIAKSNLNTSQYLLKCTLNKKINVISGLEETLIELRRIGNNINQLARLTNQGKLQTIDLNTTTKELIKIWQLLNSLIQNQVWKT